MDTSREIFQSGVSAFKSGRFHEALGHFNEVAAAGAATHVVFESRSAVYEKIGRIPDALKDARKVIELAPQSPQGYIRSSRLFLLAERPDSALRMVEMASERVSPDDVRRVERLALLRTEIKAALDVQKHHSLKKVCHISKLPFEVLSEIMLLAVDTKQPQPLNLTAVCAQWRSIATSTPQLWRTLRIRTRNPLEQLKLWTRRSGASHDMQGVLDLFVPPIAVWSDISAILGAWSQSPRFLQPSTPPLSLVLHEIGWGELVRCLRILPRPLESLTCRAPVHPSALFPLNEHSGVLLSRFSLRRLDMTGALTFESSSPSFNYIQSLRLRELRGNICPNLFFEGLRGSPSLRELELAGPTQPPTTSYVVAVREPAPRLFDCLERVIFAGDGTWSRLLEWIDAPKLKYLDLSVSSLDVCGALLHAWHRLSRATSPLPTPPLVELRLNRCGIGADGRSLCSLVNQLPFLQRLEITGCGDDVNPAILTLAGNCKSGIIVGDECPPLPCPRLQYVDFSRCSQVRGTSIRDLVKSRLPPRSPDNTKSETALDNPSVSGSLPLQAVIIDQCPNVPAELLPWLRQHVSRVSCAYETKVQAKERMPRTSRYNGP